MSLLSPLLPDQPWTTGELFLQPDPAPVDPAGFRQKVAFVFGPSPDGVGLVMGHYQRGTNRIVPVEECPVHSRRGNAVAFALRDHLARARVSPAGPTLGGVLRHVLVRTSHDDTQAVAMLVVTRNDKSLRRPVRAFLESEHKPDGFFVNIHDRPGPYMVGEQTIKIAGHSHVRETVGGVSYLVSPTAFFQTNVSAAAALQRAVVASLAGSGRILDLYCGSGLFALPLAIQGTSVVGIEENTQAVRDAEANARLNRVPSGRVRFVGGRAEDLLRSFSHEPWDGVVLDPPRQGCAPAVIDLVFRTIAPPRVTYVSCSPEAMAGDLRAILASGYRVERLRAVDMFPHTDHLETVLMLVRDGRTSRAASSRQRS